MLKRVVVTGMGAISPVGENVPTFWQNIKNGVSGIGQITTFKTDGLPVRIAAEVDDFDPLNYFNKKEAQRLDRFAMFGLIAAREAVEDSGLLNSHFDPERVGVITGTGIGGIGTLEKQHTVLLTKGNRFVSPFFVPMMIPDILPGAISIQHGFLGPNYTTISACASASHAIGISFLHIRSGDTDVIVSGGAESSITPLSLAGFSNMKALSTRNDEPEKASRPFDLKRDGFIMGEGAGMIVLEELEHALKREAKIYGEIIGYGFSADAHHITAPHPEGRGAVLAMEAAIRMSNLPKDAFSYINAHGTSTPFNDKTETLAIKSVFRQLANKLHISSTKSMIGHLMGAAGGIELIALILALRDQEIPPTINYEFPDPDCDLCYTPNISHKMEFEAGLSNNFGFGGHNAVIAAKRFQQ